MAAKPSYEDLEQQVKELKKKNIALQNKNAAVKELAAKYSTIIESIPVSIVELDKNGIIINVNDYHITTTDKNMDTKEAYENYNILKHPGIVAAGIQDNYKRLLKGETINLKSIYIPKTRAGAFGFFNIKGAPLFKDNEVIGAMVIHEDINKRKQAEEALRNSEKRLNSILDSTTAIIYIKDKEGRFTFINREFERYFNVSKEGFIGKTDYDLMPKELADRYKENDQKVIKLGEPMEIEESALLKNGKHTAISIKVPLYDDDGSIYGVCGISTDISARKQAEEALEKSYETLEKTVKERTAELEDMNAALKVLLKKRDDDKKEIEGKIFSNYKSLISPFIQKLKNSLTKKEQQNLMNIVESNLKEFLEPFSQKLSDPMVNLTPTEINDL